MLVDSRDCICKLGTEFFNLKENLKKRETHAVSNSILVTAANTKRRNGHE